MGRAQVRVAGVWLNQVGQTSGLTDSTIYRTIGDPASKDELAWSGDYQASVQWAAPPDFAASWLAPNVATFEVIETGVLTWGGILAEVTPAEKAGDLWTLTAYGYGSKLAEYLALSGSTPTYIPNTAVDQAESRDMPVTRGSTAIGASAVGTADEQLTVATLVSRAAMAVGKRFYVDSYGQLSLVAEPTVPMWGARPGSVYFGTPDDSFCSHLYGYYLDGTGTPSVVPNSDTATATEAANQLGRKERGVNLTPLGNMSAAAAGALVDGRYTLVGARMGWTNPVELDAANLRLLGWGPADPLSMCQENGAGQMIRVFGAMDDRSQLETRASIDVILGEVTRVHDDRRCVGAPVGIRWRDFEGALAAAQSPVETVTTA